MSLPENQTIPVFAGGFGSWQFSLRRRPLPPHELARRYDRMAPGWTRLTERLGYPQAYRRLLGHFLAGTDMNAPARPLRVLDCGVGTATLSLALAQVCRAPLELHAIDVSDAMLDAARQRLSQAGIDASVRRADVAALPYEDGRFDLVLAAHVLEHLPDPVTALGEMRRVLAPGGWLVACLTRQSVLGRYVQLKWRTHRLNAELGASWLRQAGFEPHPLNSNPGGCFALTSIGCAGRKANALT